MVNKVIYQGRLVADPELKYTQSNVANTEVTIAWSEKYKDVEIKCFLRCKAWRNNAEFINKYFRKGQEIVVEGHMVTEQWESDGEKKSRTVCLLEKVNFCGSKSENTKTDPARKAPSPEADPDGFMDIPDGIGDEFPFH